MRHEWWTAEDGGDLWPVYDEVFGDADRTTWLETTWGRHAKREGFRCRVAIDPHDGGRGTPGVRRPVGFAYGFVARPGQWFSDRVMERLPDIATAWVGGHFELVELAVRETYRGHGLGAALLDEVMADIPTDRALLSTSPDEHDPARRLYAGRGWLVLGRLDDQAVLMGWQGASET